MTKHLSTVLSFIAVVVAIGGGSAYAGATIAKNSVGTEQIKPGSIRSTDIRNGSVGVADLSKNARRAMPTKARLASVVEDVITDPQYGINITVKGEKGDAGPQGATGPTGVPGIRIVTETNTWGFGPKTQRLVTATCGPGENVAGGGASYVRSESGGASIEILQSYPSSPQAWTVVAELDGYGGSVSAYAVCVAKA